MSITIMNLELTPIKIGLIKLFVEILKLLVFNKKIIKQLVFFSSKYTRELFTYITNNDDKKCVEIRKTTKDLLTNQNEEDFEKFFMFNNFCQKRAILIIFRFYYLLIDNKNKEEILMDCVISLYSKSNLQLKIDQKKVYNYKKSRLIFDKNQNFNNKNIIENIFDIFHLEKPKIIKYKKSMDFFKTIYLFRKKYFDDSKKLDIISKNEEVNTELKNLDLFKIFKLIIFNFGYSSNFYREVFSYLYIEPKIKIYSTNNQKIFLPNFLIKSDNNYINICFGTNIDLFFENKINIKCYHFLKTEVNRKLKIINNRIISNNYSLIKYYDENKKLKINLLTSAKS